MRTARGARAGGAGGGDATPGHPAADATCSEQTDCAGAVDAGIIGQYKSLIQSRFAFGSSHFAVNPQ